MYLVFDIGGTKTRVARSLDGVTLDEIVKFDTDPTYHEGIQKFQKAVRSLIKGSVDGIAGGIRGPLNHEKTGITKESVLLDWVGRNIVADIKKVCDVPVYLENDTAIVGLGEVHFGAGKGHSIVAYHTVSTGVGGARYVNGKIDQAHIGFEPGHQVLDIDFTLLGKGITGTLENLVSGTALQSRRGVKPYEIPQDDPVWDELARYLAYGLRNTIMYWSPDLIVLGGSMVIGDPRILREDIVRHTIAVLEGFIPCPPIVDATLKDEGGLFGGLAILKQRLDNIK